jgi:cytochrome c-type biogenesis protein CcmF
MGASPLVVMGLTLAAWIVLATSLHLLQRLRHAPAGTSLWKRITSQPRSYWGMIVAHAGIGIFVVGVTMVKGMETASDVSMQIGDTASAGGYTFRFADLKEVRGPNYVGAQGVFDVTHGEKQLPAMKPEKRLYTVQQMPMTEAAIDRGFTRDLYVSLGEQVNKTTWVVRVQYKPFVSWIWGGCLIIALGGFLAASDRRYRLARKRRAVVDEPASGAAVGVARPVKV